MQVDYLKIELLTPVHIGTGDEVDPMGYLMRKEQGIAYCYFVDTTAWAAEHPDPQALSAHFEKSNIPVVRAYIAENLDPRCYSLRRAMVSAPQIFQEYTEKLRNQSTSNQLLISPQMSTSLGHPILPGSSVKGAIRTAVIDYLDRTRQLNLKGGSKKEYENKLNSVLGKITDNAFKQLKLSDFEGWCDSTVLVTATEVPINQKKSATPKSKAEILPSLVLGNREHAVLHGKLVMGYGQAEDPQNRRLTLNNGESWDWNELANLVNAYQQKRLEEEQRKFYTLQHFSAARDSVAVVRQALAEAEPGQMILRVGHYSQVEYVTVENNAPLTRKTKDQKILPWGTTRTLANGKLPFGWVRLTPCSYDEYDSCLQERRKHGEMIEKQRISSRQRILDEKERLAEQRRQSRLKEEEDRNHPWRKLVRQLAEIDNWGEFRNLVIDGQLQEYRDKENVAGAVRDKALELRKGKWEKERDEIIAEWLEPTNMNWEQQKTEGSNGLSDEEQALVDVISALTDWGAFNASKIAIDTLPRPALEVLRDKLREFGCNNKKAKKDKVEAWKKVQKVLKS